MQDTFGRIAIRSAYRSVTINGYGNKNKLNCASNERNYAAHIWDRRDAEGCMGARYDITSASHVAGDFPMLVAEPSFQNNATNPAKIKTFHTFDKYVLNIITKCESVIGGAIFDTLNNAGVFQATIDPQAAIAETRTAVQNSHVMPDWAKAMAAASELKPEWFVDMNNSMKDRLREALAPCDTSNPA